MTNITRYHWLKKRSVWIAFAVVLCIGVSFSHIMAAGDAQAKKVVRQIGIMESIIDKVLIDSPHFLVHGGDNTRGLYVGDFGAIFTFNASLVTKSWFNFPEDFLSLGSRFDIETNEEGDRVVILRKKTEKKKSDKEKEEELEKTEEIDPEEVYENAKQEMVQALLDYGETLSALQNDQYVVLAAFLKGDEYFKERQISRLVLKAKIGDMREYSAGRISESTVKSRISIEEY